MYHVGIYGLEKDDFNILILFSEETFSFRKCKYQAALKVKKYLRIFSYGKS